MPPFSVDDRKVFTAKVKTNIANFWQHDEFSATVSDPVVSGKWKLAIKDSTILFRSLTMVFENTPKIMFIWPPITEKWSFKKMKILLFLAPFISKTKIVDIFNFLSLKCSRYGLSFLSIWLISVKYCWNYRLPNLLFQFTWYSWQQLNDRQRKAAVNLLIHLFERYYQ